MKDRAAQAMIGNAERDGRLEPGGTVVEYTGGSTGISLAFICSVKGYRLQIVTLDAFSQDKLDQMEAFGAELTLVPSEGGLTTKKLIFDMIDKAMKITEKKVDSGQISSTIATALPGTFSLEKRSGTNPMDRWMLWSTASARRLPCREWPGH